MHLTDRRFPVETGRPHAPVAVRTAVRLSLVTQPAPDALVMLCRVCPRPFRVRIPVERSAVERGLSGGPWRHQGGVRRTIRRMTHLPAAEAGAVTNHVDVAVE